MNDSWGPTWVYTSFEVGVSCLPTDRETKTCSGSPIWKVAEEGFKAGIQSLLGRGAVLFPYTCTFLAVGPWASSVGTSWDVMRTTELQASPQIYWFWICLLTSSQVTESPRAQELYGPSKVTCYETCPQRKSGGCPPGYHLPRTGMQPVSQSFLIVLLKQKW